MQSELLELMLKFKLCYPLPNANNTYIAPQLLDANQPEYIWNDGDNLLLNYEYDFMPRGILSRFIVEMHKYIDEPNVWLTGVLLKRDDTWAEVIETYDRREIKIRLSGKNKRGFLEVITDQLDEIHDSFKKLRVKKLIPCNCDVCKNSQKPHFYKFDQLRKFVDNNILDTRCDESLLTVNVLSLIDDIFGREKFLQEFLQEKSDMFNAIITRTKPLIKNRERETSGIIVIGDVHGDIKMQNPQQGDIHEEIQVVNNQQNIVTSSENTKLIKVKSAWFNGSFYLCVASIVFGIITFAGKQISLPVLILGILGTAMLTLIIGFLQLKQDDRLKDESFLALMTMVIGSLPLIGNPPRGLLNPKKEDNN